MFEIIQQNIFWLLIVFVVLLLMGLFYQLKLQIRKMMQNEIYDHFPSIKNKIEDYERAIHNLRLQVEELERRMRELRR